MKIRLPTIIGPVLFLATLPVQAQQSGEELVRSSMCYACHQLDEVSLGPPWRAIAARHASRRELMIAVLTSKILHGGGGNWGLVPMVPNQHVDADQARLMAEWILSLAPSE